MCGFNIHSARIRIKSVWLYMVCASCKNEGCDKEKKILGRKWQQKRSWKMAPTSNFAECQMEFAFVYGKRVALNGNDNLISIRALIPTCWEKIAAEKPQEPTGQVFFSSGMDTFASGRKHLTVKAWKLLNVLTFIQTRHSNLYCKILRNSSPKMRNSIKRENNFVMS